MNKTVLITGASSGIGHETAKLFQTKNWRVAATMRKPEDAEALQRIADIECFRLDVTDPDSIRTAIDRALEKFGRIDAVVNNAGYGLIGAFETVAEEQIKRQFDTNVFGLMNVCRAILPHFREQKRGVIVNVASISGRVGLPASSLYSSTKFAVEGFSEALRYELEPFNIRVKLIEPGPIKTEFYGRSMDVAETAENIPEYARMVERVLANMNSSAEGSPDGSAVAAVIYDAVTDNSRRLRYGINSKGVPIAKRLLSDSMIYFLLKKNLLK